MGKVINEKKSKKHVNKDTVGSKVLKLNDRKRLTINYFKSKPYLHINDCYSRKTFTFNYDEVKLLSSKIVKILKIMKNISNENKTKTSLYSDSSDDNEETGSTSYESE